MEACHDWDSNLSSHAGLRAQTFTQNLSDSIASSALSSPNDRQSHGSKNKNLGMVNGLNFGSYG